LNKNFRKQKKERKKEKEKKRQKEKLDIFNLLMSGCR